MLLVERRTGKTPERLANAPSCPAGFAQLWRDFLALHSTRAAGMGGAMRITWSEIDAYQRVNGIRLAAWEIEAIRRADGEFMAHQSETSPKPKG